MTAVTTLACVTTSVASGADEAYPGQPIRIIVPVAAGGFQDVISRSFAQRMSATLGQTIISLNSAMNAAKNDPALMKQLSDSGQELPAQESVATFNKFLQGESARYLKVIRERGIKG